MKLKQKKNQKLTVHWQDDTLQLHFAVLVVGCFRQWFVTITTIIITITMIILLESRAVLLSAWQQFYACKVTLLWHHVSISTDQSITACRTHRELHPTSLTCMIFGILRRISSLALWFLAHPVLVASHSMLLARRTRRFFLASTIRAPCIGLCWSADRCVAATNTMTQYSSASVHSNLKQGNIVAVRGSFNRIRQLASMCTPHLMHGSLGHASPHPEQHLDPLIHFCRVHVAYSQTATSRGIWTPILPSIGRPQQLQLCRQLVPNSRCRDRESPVSDVFSTWQVCYY